MSVSLKHIEPLPAKFVDRSQIHSCHRQPACEGMAQSLRSDAREFSMLARSFKRRPDAFVGRAIGFWKAILATCSFSCFNAAFTVELKLTGLLSARLGISCSHGKGKIPASKIDVLPASTPGLDPRPVYTPTSIVVTRGSLASLKVVSSSGSRHLSRLSDAFKSFTSSRAKHQG
jgi:hypothetical protein